MLSIEGLCVGQSHFGHFDVAEDESVVFNGFEDFADVLVAVGLDHSEGFSTFIFKLFPGEDVGVVYDFELATVDGYNGADEEVFEGYLGVGTPPEEDFVIFEIVLD